MKNEFVTYEHALKLKKLGFDEPTFGYFVDGELRGVNLGYEELGGIEPYYQRFGFHTLNNHHIDNPNKVVVTAPLKQQVFSWFREKGYYGEIFVDDDKTFGYYITNFVPLGRISHPLKRGYLTYEESEEECIEKLIELIENGTEENL
jgi:hypothetical protein